MVRGCCWSLGLCFSLLELPLCAWCAPLGCVRSWVWMVDLPLEICYGVYLCLGCLFGTWTMGRSPYCPCLCV